MLVMRTEKKKETDGRIMTGRWTMLCCEQYEHGSSYVSNVAVLCSSKSSGGNGALRQQFAYSEKEVELVRNG